MNVENAVRDRYTAGARETMTELCCPVNYDSDLLRILPREIIERDYGCGDPTPHVLPGDTVLDLGSGSGKVCYMAAQLTGAGGRVIGVDMNTEMLALARKHQKEMAIRLGGDRVEFRRGLIQDLALDVDAMESWLETHPVRNSADLEALADWQREQRNAAPLVAPDSVDLVISNCVLNLVRDDLKQQMIAGIHRVVKPGGRIAISDIVSDRPVPVALKQDPKLWSGCISGAFREQDFLEELRRAGFQFVRIDHRAPQPWRTIDGIEFRSVTVTAVKPLQHAGDSRHTVIYRGPFRCVRDDGGREYARGEMVDVDARTLAMLLHRNARDSFICTSAGDGGLPAACCDPTPADTGSCVRPAAGTGGSCCS